MSGTIIRITQGISHTVNMANSHSIDATDLDKLARDIKRWGSELGFQQVAITDTRLDGPASQLASWLDKGYQGDMNWLGAHSDKRWQPAALVPDTRRIIMVRMDYLPGNTALVKTLRNPDKAYISRYALGRDYHKLIRKRLAQLAGRIDASHPHSLSQRPFVDSAPVLEKPLAQKAGLGWMGKHTLIINKHAGSWFFLGEIYTSLELPVDSTEARNLCGNCSACLSVCPTNAFPEPYVLDARRCISYLTIEHKGAIPEELRPLMGNRVFGCDDCQAICPWNRFARPTGEGDFQPRHQLQDSDLTALFSWREQEFEFKTAGSAIRRIGYERWLRNLAVGLGNASNAKLAISVLKARRDDASSLVREHIDWALDNLARSQDQTKPRPFPEIEVVE